MSPEQLLVLMQSFIASVLLIGPLLIAGRAMYRYFVPKNTVLRMQNWNDSIIRPVALCLFLTMVVSALYLMIVKPDFYALISPVEFVLGFFFFPLYKRME